MKLLHVVGARPNFPKLAPVYRALAAQGDEQIVVHTGQHYDEALSESFFRDLDMAPPDVNLEVGSGTHGYQTGLIMQKIEPVFAAQRPDWVVLYGDVNSTLAGAVVASKLDLRIVHVEAGLRSYDRRMPEEINRIVTDRLSDLLLTPSRDADAVLLREGARPDQIEFVGNVMIDTLLHSLDRARNTGFARQQGWHGDHVVVTLHRPSNVDEPARLKSILGQLAAIARKRPVVLACHPRTKARLGELDVDVGRVMIVEPLPYHHMLDAVAGAHAVVTDSGGLQEETTALGVPCFTLRDNTERPITISEGTNQLVLDLETLAPLVDAAARSTNARRPEGWDGRAGERVAAALKAHLAS